MDPRPQEEVSGFLGCSTRTLRRYMKNEIFPEPLYKNKYIAVFGKDQLEAFKKDFVDHPFSRVSSKVDTFER